MVMELTGLHILLTYICNFECDHCFVWGSPWQTGTFTLAQLDNVFKQANEVDSIQQIYFEGGEAFLYYPILVEAVGRAKKFGFSTGIVTNGYWATGGEDAWIWLQPLAAAGLDALDISCDLFHGDEISNGKPHPGIKAAQELFIDTGTIAVDPPTGMRDPEASEPGLPLAGGDVMYRGRAAKKLVGDLPLQPWNTFSNCPYEDLANPGRIHLDPFGNLHLCQGIVIGNLFEQPLKEILAHYDPLADPIVGPLLEGGPTELTVRLGIEHEDGYVDACHLCYTAREAARNQFPAALAPDQVYGVYGDSAEG
jgi:MoaA/NifB/PqqE/SkfB family radical SAM enzyme